MFQDYVTVPAGLKSLYMKTTMSRSGDHGHYWMATLHVVRTGAKAVYMGQASVTAESATAKPLPEKSHSGTLCIRLRIDTERSSNVLVTASLFF